MSKINQELLSRISRKLGVTRNRVYALIDHKVRTAHLPRNLAAIAVASERGINISKYASVDDLATIRQTAVKTAPPSVIVPEIRANVENRKKSVRTPHRTGILRRGTSVFVVHGRNDNARKGVFAFLRAIGLQPIEWNQAIKKTGQATPYVGTILDTAFREAAAVVVVLTPDDETRLQKKYRKSNDPPFEKRLTGQSRPNVLFEAGMAFGRNPENTVLVQIGEIRPFSDVAGRHILHLSNDPTSRQEFATRLANAGCNVNTTGTDWLKEGDLSSGT